MFLSLDKNLLSTSLSRKANRQGRIISSTLQWKHLKFDADALTTLWLTVALQLWTNLSFLEKGQLQFKLLHFSSDLTMLPDAAPFQSPTLPSNSPTHLFLVFHKQLFTPNKAMLLPITSLKKPLDYVSHSCSITHLLEIGTQPTLLQREHFTIHVRLQRLKAQSSNRYR